MDLFEYAKSKTLDQESPLASRLRPTTLDEVVGQQHIIGKNTLLYRAIKADKLTSVIFYGPPGTGKTTLAKVIANTTSAEFTQINATVAGKKDMETVVKEAQQNLGMYGKKTILFIDEIHRFNKGQQDYLLPFVEDGTIILIGATTENPYFEVNAALISRSIIFELKSLEIPEVKELILRAVNDKKKGMGNYKAQIDEDALDFLADMAGGDAPDTPGAHRAYGRADAVPVVFGPLGPHGLAAAHWRAGPAHGSAYLSCHKFRSVGRSGFQLHHHAGGRPAGPCAPAYVRQLHCAGRGGSGAAECGAAV